MVSKARPHLFFELRHHRSRGDDQNAYAPADQFGKEHADFDGLSESDRIGEQYAMAVLT